MKNIHLIIIINFFFYFISFVLIFTKKKKIPNTKKKKKKKQKYSKFKRHILLLKIASLPRKNMTYLIYLDFLQWLIVLFPLSVWKFLIFLEIFRVFTHIKIIVKTVINPQRIINQILTILLIFLYLKLNWKSLNYFDIFLY